VGEAVRRGEEGRDRADVPDLVVGEAGGAGLGEVGFAEQLGRAGQREGQVGDRTAALIEFRLPGVGGPVPERTEDIRGLGTNPDFPAITPIRSRRSSGSSSSSVTPNRLSAMRLLRYVRCLNV
jgi:hypothetical protein